MYKCLEETNFNKRLLIEQGVQSLAHIENDEGLFGMFPLFNFNLNGFESVISARSLVSMEENLKNPVIPISQNLISLDR